MKITVCINDIENSMKVSSSFGKAHYFLIYDLNTERLLEKLKNHFSSSAGAEIFCAQLLIKKGINLVICGKCENDAKKLFSEAKVSVIENIEGNPAVFVNEFYHQYKTDKLHYVTE